MQPCTIFRYISIADLNLYEQYIDWKNLRALSEVQPKSILKLIADLQSTKTSMMTVSELERFLIVTDFGKGCFSRHGQLGFLTVTAL